MAWKKAFHRGVGQGIVEREADAEGDKAKQLNHEHHDGDALG